MVKEESVSRVDEDGAPRLDAAYSKVFEVGCTNALGNCNSERSTSFLKKGEGIRRRQKAALGDRRNAMIRKGEIMAEVPPSKYDPDDYPHQWKIFQARAMMYPWLPTGLVVMLSNIVCTS
jgi:hypothetical protein